MILHSIKNIAMYKKYCTTKYATNILSNIAYQSKKNYLFTNKNILFGMNNYNKANLIKIFIEIMDSNISTLLIIFPKIK